MDADQATVHYQHGLLVLERYLHDGDEAVLHSTVDALAQATALRPEHAAYRAALGFALDAAGRPTDALSELREACRLDPENREVEVLAATLLAESGAEGEALEAIGEAAARQRVDLDSLRRELQAADMPVNAATLIANGFIHARNYMRSRLEDEIEQARRSTDPGGWNHARKAQVKECQGMQAVLERSLDPQHVPSAFRNATKWARRLGIGDDVCRGVLLRGLTAEEREELASAVTGHAPAIHRWLDGFAPEAMPPEAAAFMYLLLGVEEMQQGS